MRRTRAVSLAIVLGSIACRSNVDHLVNPKPGVEFETATTHVPQFTDIPVPLGFRAPQDNFETYITEAGSFRSGRQVYLGNSRVVDVLGYYEERMPHHGWIPMDRTTTSVDVLTMLWRKAYTTARIDLRAEGTSNGVRIDIRVGTSLDPNFRP